MHQLGKRIAYIRHVKRISQLSLSIDTGLSKSYLSDLERGKRNPTVKILNRICMSLNITLEYLFKGIVDLDQLL
ncbi:MAG: helix-turn-helix domain-containing protein [Bacilli bacterium]|nr:helix-turn-helix domain-containing protein [Bacilli bacterium]